jgi:2TM domain
VSGTMDQNVSGPDRPGARDEARRWVRRLRILYTVVGIYLVLSLMWFAIDMADGTESIWFYWPMLGTGVVVAVVAVVMLGVGGCSVRTGNGAGSTGTWSATTSADRGGAA